MEPLGLPDWETDLVEKAIRVAEQRLEAERERARRRALQLAREQGYHRLAAAIERPAEKSRVDGQLTLFPTEATLFPAD